MEPKRVPNQKPSIKIQPRIAIIGEAPGAEEARQGIPFVGPSGRLLDSALSAITHPRQGCFIGNVYQYTLPGNDLLHIEGDKLRESLDTLRAELAEYKPDVIVTLGDFALQHIANKSKITNWRGSIIKSPEYGTIVPTYHPALVLRQWSWYPVFRLDLRKAVAEGRDPKPLPSRTFNINPTLEEVRDYFHRIRGHPVAFDIETTQSHRVICIGFSASSDYALVIPFTNTKWTEDEEIQVWDLVSEILTDSRTPKIAHNSQFDVGFLAYYYGILTSPISMDTMIAHHACYPEMPKSLAFCCSIYTREPFYKDELEKYRIEEQEWGDKAPIDTLLIYNAKDCCVTYECSQVLETELDRLGARGGYNIDMESIPIALEMTLRGIKVDLPTMRLEYQKIQEQIDQIDALAEQAFGCKVNTKSPKQMKELLYERLGYAPVLSEAGALSTNADALIRLSREYRSEAINLLLRNRQLRTKQSFFSLTLHTDGRIHPSYNIAGTKTGRWSSSAGFLGGRNLMNIPDDCRNIFVADEGKVLVGWDKAQAEARVVACKALVAANSPFYFSLINGNQKIHVWFGLRLIERGIADISVDEFLARETEKAKMWYYISKMSIHGFSYDLGPVKWCDVIAKETDGAVVIPYRTGKTIKEALYTEIPSIPQWQQCVSKQVLRFRKLETCFGRTRLFFNRGSDLLSEAYAFEPQSTVADDVAISIKRLAEAAPWIELLQQNYDSLLAQCEKSKEDEALELMSKICARPMTIKSFDTVRYQELIIPIELKSGYNWRDMKEAKKQ